MNANDCKLIRGEIDDSELGQELSSSARRHINECGSCRDFLESGTKLRQLVGSLVQVEAPADFDFRLSARLARESSRRSLPWNFSFAIPAVALAAVALIVGGVFMFRRPTTETTVATNPRIEAPAPTPIAPTLIDAGNKPTAINVVSKNTTKPPKRSNATARRNNVVSETFSGTRADVIRRDQPVPAQLIFPLQTLTLSVDDGKGVQRTISFPSVSFGSQRVLAGNGSSFQSPDRTNW
jgi:hypothetical protein